ncbi:MAG: CRISPR-associated endonuclease Cas2 [Planctomycetota bacterium]
MRITGYRLMWVLAMFDLPTKTKPARKEYARFRKRLLTDGFQQMQYSVYARPCPSRENADVHVGRIEAYLPHDGEVRVLVITDKQFERMQIFWRKRRRVPEQPPNQLELF